MTHKYLKNVVSLSFDSEQCIGCGRCLEVCPHGVFTMIGDTAQIIGKDKCMECGACALNCPMEAIRVNAGVGCASAYVKSWFTGQEPTCDCGNGGCC